METARNEQHDLESIVRHKSVLFFVLRNGNAKTYRQTAFKHMLRPEMLTLYVHKLTVY